MRWLTTRCFNLLALIAACGPTDAAPTRDQLGDPCRSAARHCADEDAIFVCHDRAWTIRDCDEVCSDIDSNFVSRGCMVVPTGTGMATECVCEPADGPECDPGHKTCARDDTLATCTPYATWETLACADLCADEPVPLASRGCEEDHRSAWCNCSAEGQPCPSEGQVACAGSDTLATCIEGHWEFEECIVECPGRPRCDPLTDPPACTC